MFAFCIGFFDKFFNKLIFCFSRFAVLLGQADDAGAVVLFCLVLHLVVHACLFGLEGTLAVAYGIDEFRDGKFGHLLQRVEDVHHHQVVLGGMIQMLKVGMTLVGRGVVVGILFAEGVAEFSQLSYQDMFGQRQKDADFRIGEVVVLAYLHLADIAEEKVFVDLKMVLFKEKDNEIL